MTPADGWSQFSGHDLGPVPKAQVRRPTDVTAYAICAALDISRAQLASYIDAGMPTTRSTGGHSRRFDIETCRRWVGASQVDARQPK